ncbi:MAG: ATP-binding protein [Candidatus Methanomethylophilaceae archaeon]|nr:ATP-binding protein [Candidatus Methanomethylophilaceae archaeon]
MLPDSEDATTVFISGLDHLDDALRSMTAMMNRYNRADIYIGVDDQGNVIGIDADDDTIEMMRNRMSQVINHVPDVTITVESDDSGRKYIRITGTGYDIPYSFKGWFYARRCF